MAVTNADKQASWRERHLKNENGIKLHVAANTTPHGEDAMRAA
jgi:hypothetical protein